MSTSSDDSAPLEPITWRDGVAIVRVLTGVVVGLAAFLLLTTAPDLLFQWIHRDGYRPTEAVVERSTLALFTVRLPAGKEITVKSTRAHGHEGAQTVFYNPDAIVTLGIRLFDERIVFSSVPRSAAEGLLPSVITVVLAAAAFWLLRGSPEKPRTSRRARKDRGGG